MSLSQSDYFPNGLMMKLAGNEFFLNKVLFIDTENNFFGNSQ
ncbi:hypothetical protein P700755_003230 [Psychroflexus torquis ATCC 700755]|uniref:Uncharacterized protein n=1 Tax=Psychroflexus torquis (strain ATCC 700755 / CIP 106069 / ACAM 623) TaxID=313595 RepID=K4IWN4_PSYTT|nr:hypothetical protein P700755_003230 [Psychroflexus torquis ATCC 700755]